MLYCLMLASFKMYFFCVCILTYIHLETNAVDGLSQIYIMTNSKQGTLVLKLLKKSCSPVASSSSAKK